jgi:hypothetical protein
MRVDIIIVGCGGTGGCFFTRIARFLSDAVLDVEVKLRIMDGDKVEMKNLGRQPFMEEDIGENKAVALAAAAEESLGLQVSAYPTYLSPETTGILTSSPFSGYSADVQILIGAVDNHAARKLLHERFIEGKRNSRTIIYLDSANEFSCGEITIGKCMDGKIVAPDRVHYFPTIFNDPGKAVYEMSCEELNRSAPQHLATNSFAADLLFAYCSQLLLSGEKMKLANGGIIWFDTFKMFSRFDPYEEDRHGKVE